MSQVASTLLPVPTVAPVQPWQLPGFGATITLQFVLKAAGNVSGGSTQTFPAVGTFFYVTQLTGAGQIEIQPNNDGANPFFAGQGNNPPAGKFNSIEVRNPNNFVVSGQIVVGTSTETGFIEKRVILVPGSQAAPLVTEPQATFPVGSGVASLAAGATLTLTGLGQSGPRHQLEFLNQDAALSLNVLDVNGNLFTVIAPGNPWTWQSQGTFKLFNPNGAPVAIAAGETYFST